MNKNWTKAKKIKHDQNKAWKKLKQHSKVGFYQSWEWKKLRFEVLKAYGATCMLCNSTERLVVDHIKSPRLYPGLELSFDNCQVLCSDCNRGKSWNDESDFRPKCPKPELEGAELAHFKSILN